VANRAKKLMKQSQGTYIDQVHFPARRPFMNRLQPGDWLITSIQNGRSADIWPPRQLLSIESYPRGKGKRRWTFQLEAPKSEESIALGTFRRRVGAVLRTGGSNLRTRPITDSFIAHAIHSLWTSAGRASSKQSL
jgi:hypothetical protein